MLSIRFIIAVALCAATAGCVTPGVGPMEPPGISSAVRKEVHRLAIRGPNPPKVTLTSDLDGKGAAAGKSAAAAGVGWIGGTMQAAGDAGEGAGLVMAFGLVTAPIAIAGGALYGASSADTKDAIAEGNATLSAVLDFAPDRFRQALDAKFAEAAPVAYEFTGELDDAELEARGFDAVLDVRMDTLGSTPSENDFHVYFDYLNHAELRVLNHPDLTRSRRYPGRLPSRAVSSWAKDGGRPALSELDGAYQETASQIVADFFLRKAIQVQGLEPMSRGWSVGTVPGTVPMLVWSARDGARHALPGPDVEYEVLIYTGSKAPQSGPRTKSLRYVPREPLQACRRYRWQVRAHYVSFGQPVQSDWTPVYRFKTPCD